MKLVVCRHAMHLQHREALVLERRLEARGLAARLIDHGFRLRLQHQCCHHQSCAQ